MHGNEIICKLGGSGLINSHNQTMVIKPSMRIGRYEAIARIGAYYRAHSSRVVIIYVIVFWVSLRHENKCEN